MDAIQQIIDGKIDFQGQRLADRIMQETLVMGAAVALVVGWWLQNLYLCMLMYGLSFFVALVLTVPPWPFYNKHHVVWLPSSTSSLDASTDPALPADKAGNDTLSKPGTKRTKKSSQL